VGVHDVVRIFKKFQVTFLGRALTLFRPMTLGRFAKERDPPVIFPEWSDSGPQ
jgi:hypothetical protein